MILRNHYETLGINKGANDDDVKKAYHRLAKLYHPDKNNGSQKAEEKFKEVAQAYEVMKSKDRREIWEREFVRQQQTLREHRNESNNRPQPTRSASVIKTPEKKQRNQSAKNETKNNKKDTTETKYTFFFTDSDCEDENISAFFRKSRKTRSQSYSGPSGNDAKPKWSKPFPRQPVPEKQTTTEAEKENTFSFNFGFNIFMDTDNGFQSFFDPFHMYYDWQEKPHRFREFSDDDDEYVQSFRADCRKKRNTAREFAGNTGEQNWYDWTRAFQPMGSDDDESSMVCAFCRKHLPIDMLRKHESRCRRFSGGVDILGFQRRQAEMDNIRRRRHSAQPEKISTTHKDELITCLYCFRKFSHKIAEKHIDFCAKQTLETGRPMNPLGKSAAARDYSSRNFTAKEYAKTVPKPKGQPTNTSQKQKSKSRSREEIETDDTGVLNNLKNEKNKKASSHTSSAKSVPHPNVNKLEPKSRKSKSSGTRSTKPSLIDVNVPPPVSRFTSGVTGPPDMSSFPGVGCATCQHLYGQTSAHVICSCGVKKSLPTH